MNADGNADDMEHGTSGFPISYVRSTDGSEVRPQIHVEFGADKLTEGVYQIRGLANGPSDLVWTGTATKNGNTLAACLTSDGALPNTIANWDMKIDWQITRTVNGVTDTVAAPSSTNHLYVTGTASEGAFETVLQVGCDAAQGLRPAELHELEPAASAANQAVFDAIWAKFASKHIQRADGALLSYFGFFDKNGNGKWDPGIDTPYNREDLVPADLAGLLNMGNGQCFAWVDFLAAALDAQGVSSVGGSATKKILVTKGLGSGFAINNRTKHGPGNPIGTPHWVINDRGFDAGLDGSLEVKNPDENEAVDAMGIAAQGNSPNPPSNFSRHTIFFFGGKYYDPSFGIGGYSDRKKYEEAAFSGYIQKNEAGVFHLFDASPDNNDPADSTDLICSYE